MSLEINNNEENENEEAEESEDGKTRNANYMRMARSRSKKQSKLFTMRNKINLPKIRNQAQVLNEVYKNKKLHGPIHVFTDSNKKYKKPKGYSSKPNFSYLKMENFEQKKSQDYNVFGNEDERINELVMKFKEELKERRIDKMTRRKNALNKLYNITPEYNLRMQEARKFKSLDLDEYQKNILSSVPYNCIGKNEILDLVDTFKTLKNECDSVKPFPAINVKIIKDHILKKSRNNKNVKSMRLKEFLSQSNRPNDEYEKEQRLIRELKCFKVVTKFKRNKNYDILPIHIRESLKKNLKLHL